jgi:hypothetical protein
VSELETEYEGRIDFSIIQTATEEGSDVEQYDVGNHGLVIFDADGNVIETIAGHNIEKQKIVAICKQLTAE